MMISRKSAEARRANAVEPDTAREAVRPHADTLRASASPRETALYPLSSTLSDAPLPRLPKLPAIYYLQPLHYRIVYTVLYRGGETRGRRSNRSRRKNRYHQNRRQQEDRRKRAEFRQLFTVIFRERCAVAFWLVTPGPALGHGAPLFRRSPLRGFRFWSWRGPGGTGSRRGVFPVSLGSDVSPPRLALLRSRMPVSAAVADEIGGEQGAVVRWAWGVVRSCRGISRPPSGVACASATPYARLPTALYKAPSNGIAWNQIADLGPRFGAVGHWFRQDGKYRKRK